MKPQTKSRTAKKSCATCGNPEYKDCIASGNYGKVCHGWQPKRKNPEADGKEPKSEKETERIDQNSSGAGLTACRSVSSSQSAVLPPDLAKIKEKSDREIMYALPYAPKWFIQRWDKMFSEIAEVMATNCKTCCQTTGEPSGSPCRRNLRVSTAMNNEVCGEVLAQKDKRIAELEHHIDQNESQIAENVLRLANMDKEIEKQVNYFKEENCCPEHCSAMDEQERLLLEDSGKVIAAKDKRIAELETRLKAIAALDELQKAVEKA